MPKKVVENTKFFILVFLFSKERYLKLVFLEKTKQLKTVANKVNVPVHKNQKHVILKNKNQPNLLSKLNLLAFLKI